MKRVEIQAGMFEAGAHLFFSALVVISSTYVLFFSPGYKVSGAGLFFWQLFFGLILFIYGMTRLLLSVSKFRLTEPALVIDEDGIHDRTGLRYKFLPWDNIASMGTQRNHGGTIHWALHFRPLKSVVIYLNEPAYYTAADKRTRFKHKMLFGRKQVKIYNELLAYPDHALFNIIKGAFEEYTMQNKQDEALTTSVIIS